MMNDTTNKTLLMGLLTETSLHAGVGQAIDVVDLPIQREAHTGYPCVFGSAVKGALRTLANDTDTEKDEIKTLFGDEGSAGQGSEYAGALLITDARLLLLPVRSLTSHFKWVTCPFLLNRLKNDYKRLNLPELQADIKFESKINEIEAIMPNGATEKDSGMLFLEEFRFNVKKQKLDSIINFIAELMGKDDAKEALKKQLVIVSDDIFSHLVRYATPVNAHIKMKEDGSKTVQDGALWYEETLPPDTLLYVGVVAQRARQKEINEASTSSEVLGEFKKLFKSRPYLQLGGNETLGMGWCKVTLL